MHLTTEHFELLMNYMDSSSNDLIKFSMNNFENTKRLTYYDWLCVLMQIKNRPVALYNYLPFVRTALNLDFYTVIMGMSFIEQNVKDYLRSAYAESRFLETGSSPLERFLEERGSDFRKQWLEYQKTLCLI